MFGNRVTLRAGDNLPELLDIDAQNEAMMTTKLERPLKREIEINGKPYVVTLTVEGLKVTEKGHRKGPELKWQSLVNGDSALAAGLNASLANTESTN